MARLSRLSKLGEWIKLAESSGYKSSVLSHQLQISQRQLRRYTQQHFGKSPHKWLNEQKLKSAARILAQNQSVKATAFVTGFKQVSHFSREFKLFYGIPPSKFIEWSNAQTVSQTPHDRNR